MNQTLSVVIITKNEQDMLPGCLKSISWANEIIVIDCGSTDKTVSLAKKTTQKVFTHDWQGFASQKNFGIHKATSDWVLILDADERVSPSLRKEIQQLLKNDSTNLFAAYNIPFRNFFLGKEMKHGGWQGETHIRLFQKGKALYHEQEIHEFLDIQGDTGHLTHEILHFSHRDISSNLLKTRQYAIIQAAYEYQRGMPKVTQWSLFRGIIEHFWLRYVTLKGYKDGMEGFVEATYQAFSQIFVIQSMLWEHQRGESVIKLYEKLEKKVMAE